jgi:two-component system, response regulator PdtaR
MVVRQLEIGSVATDDCLAPLSERRQKLSSVDEIPGSFGARSGPLRVAIAEDDFLIAMQTEDALSAAGLRVVGIARTAGEVIELARRERPRLVIMDIRLGGRRDGVEAARELFQQFGIRCIFATANDDPHTRERAEIYAPLGWLTKPYTVASLLAAVADALGALR